jgi:pimeloyl-ACP methyl ester carboxylesterase
MPLLQTDAVTFYYTVTGRATRYPPLVLLHGAGGSRLDWPVELQRMPGVQVWTLDLPGHGRSSGAGRTTIAGYAQDVRAFLNAAHIARAVAVGHSMGGAIAQQLALDHPECVAGLVLIATGSRLPVEPALPERILRSPAVTIQQIVEWAWHPATSAAQLALASERLAQTSPAILRGDFLACRAFDLRGRESEIKVPVLVIGAAHDRMVRPAFSVMLAERMPRARLVMIGEAGHMVMLERPAEVAHAIMEWLGEQPW